MASLIAIRAGLAANIRTAVPRTFEAVPDSVPVPCAIVGMPEEIDYDQAMARGADTWLIPVRIYVGKVAEKAAQALIDGYLDSTAAGGLKAAIESDRTLGGAAHAVVVTRARGYGVYEVGAAQLLGVEFLVEVHT